ncbi:MAG TPA: NADP-dependent oxidoreductase [Candidatus Saccharimonadales bacterium]|jgi:NADPH-dependent curcumin reductase CurA|nr:NADP-dependent oxidoreductase [Candidatus Saccharimonadales bacterium]
MPEMNTQIVLASRPQGWVKESDFRIQQAPLPAASGGQVLLKTLYLSLDPYMRGRMNEVASYAANVQIGEVMVGETISEVVESSNPGFQPGDTVSARAGWQSYALSDGTGLRKVDTRRVPATAHLGAVGMPGVTAWYGLLKIGGPKEGETVVVSAASGAVGGVVGQIAKLKGCRVVGVAGGAAKCDYVVKELGFDACIDHRAEGLVKALAAATPKGIDVYFENVGGAVLDAVLARCNPFARIPVCGMIADYNATDRYGVKNLISAVGNRLKFQGFIVSDHMGIWPEALGQLAQWVGEGKIKYRETVVPGLENAPNAFVGLFKGENFGKLVVKVHG